MYAENDYDDQNSHTPIIQAEMLLHGNILAIIDKAIRYNRELDVTYIPGSPATVRVCSYPRPVKMQQSISIIYHMTNGSRFERFPDGIMVPMMSVNREVR